MFHLRRKKKKKESEAVCILDNNTSTQRMQRCAHNEPPLFFSFFFKGSLYNDNKSSWVSKKKKKGQTNTHTHSSSFACFALAGACNKHRALSPSLISKQGKTTGDDGKTLRCAKATRRCSLHAVVVIIELPCFFSFFIARGHLAVVVPFFLCVWVCCWTEKYALSLCHLRVRTSNTCARCASFSVSFFLGRR